MRREKENSMDYVCAIVRGSEISTHHLEKLERKVARKKKKKKFRKPVSRQTQPIYFKKEYTIQHTKAHTVQRLMA